MELLRSLLLFAAIECGVGACSGSVITGSETNGDDAGTGSGQNTFTLTSTEFADMGAIGGEYQCGSPGASPPLGWTAGPLGTESYAIVMVGPDNAGVGSAYHWVIWNIPATTTAVPEAVARIAMPPVPAGSSQISPDTDGSTWPGYSGPCSALPAAYTFTVFALKVAVLPGVTPASKGADVFAAIQANAIASAQLTGLASHYRS